jgi:hypothetical protein
VSLKAFHIFFITVSSAMAFGCGAWSLKSYSTPDGRTRDLLFGIGSLLASVALIVYGRYFLKKLKKVSYL